MQLNSQDALISELSSRAKFTKGDVKIIYDSLVGILEDLVKNHEHFSDGETKKLLLKSRGLGSLYLQKIPERKGKDGRMLPVTTRPVFRLAQNIRFSNKQMVEVED